MAKGTKKKNRYREHKQAKAEKPRESLSLPVIAAESIPMPDTLSVGMPISTGLIAALCH